MQQPERPQTHQTEAQGGAGVALMILVGVGMAEEEDGDAYRNELPVRVDKPSGALGKVDEPGCQVLGFGVGIGIRVGS